MKLYWRMAWRSLWRNSRRTIATASAIVAGSAGLNLLGGYILRVERHLRANSVYVNRVGHIEIYKKDGLDKFLLKPSKYLINGEELKSVRLILDRLPQIDFYTPTLVGVGLLGNGEKSVPVYATGIEPQAERKAENHPDVRRWVTEFSSSRDADDAYFQKSQPEEISITKELGVLIGRSVPFSQLSPEQKDLQLAGISYAGDLNAVNATLQFRHSTGFSLTEDTSLRAPFSLLQNLYQTNGAASLALFLKPDTSIAKTIKQLHAAFQNQGLDLEIYPFDNEKISLFYVGTMNFLYIMAGFFVFLISTAAALAIMNSITIGILERGREIGTLRAIGFKEKEIVWMFTREGILLTVMGLGVGFLLAQVIAFFVNKADIQFKPPGIVGSMQFILTPDLLLCVAIAIPLFLVSLICCYGVSKKLLKKPIVELLVGQ
jgi:putative ABC transport system permease protein